jgi:hypothetical protein
LSFLGRKQRWETGSRAQRPAGVAPIAALRARTDRCEGLCDAQIDSATTTGDENRSFRHQFAGQVLADHHSSFLVSY